MPFAIHDPNFAIDNGCSTFPAGVGALALIEGVGVAGFSSIGGSDHCTIECAAVNGIANRLTHGNS